MSRLLSIVLGMLLLASPAAAQAPKENLVIFGDSVAADPPLNDYLSSIAAKLTDLPGPQCPTSPESYGVNTAEQLGLEARDYSCAGAATTPSNLLELLNVTVESARPPFSEQVDRALAEGALDAGTERILITVGFNDTYSNYGDPTEAFLAAMLPQLERMRSAAPQARIQLVGYPSIVDGEHICLVNTDRLVRVHAPVFGVWERQAQDMNVALAEAAGVEFLDLKEATAGRHMCASDADRYWSAIVDDGPTNLPFHLNAPGHEYVAGIIAQS